jgi:hypothetical protein
MSKIYPIKMTQAVFPLVNTKQIGEQINQSRATLRRWRVTGVITERIHWQYAPNSRTRILWNRDLIRSWVACGGDKNDPAHQKAIESYLKSLPG